MIAGLSFTGGGAVLLWTAFLCMTENLKRNSFVGLRTSATLANDTAWIAAHKASAWSIALAGAALFASGTWMLAVRPPQRSTRNILAITIVVVVVAVLIGGFQADRVARSHG